MMIVPPGVPASGAYVVVNRSTSPVPSLGDGSVEAGALAGASEGAAVGAALGAVVGLVPPQAATRIAAPANRPTNFRIKAPPSCVGFRTTAPWQLMATIPARRALGRVTWLFGFGAGAHVRRPPRLRSGEDRLPCCGCQIPDRGRAGVGPGTPTWDRARVRRRRSRAPPSTAAVGRRGSVDHGIGRRRPGGGVRAGGDALLRRPPCGGRRAARCVHGEWRPGRPEADLGRDQQRGDARARDEPAQLRAPRPRPAPLGQRPAGAMAGTGMARYAVETRRSAATVSASSVTSSRHRPQPPRWSRAAVRVRAALAPVHEVDERREVPPAGGAAHGPPARAPDHGPASDGSVAGSPVSPHAPPKRRSARRRPRRSRRAWWRRLLTVPSGRPSASAVSWRDRPSR